jgi:hypothetical protein
MSERNRERSRDVLVLLSGGPGPTGFPVWTPRGSRWEEGVDLRTAPKVERFGPRDAPDRGQGGFVHYILLYIIVYYFILYITIRYINSYYM